VDTLRQTYGDNFAAGVRSDAKRDLTTAIGSDGDSGGSTEVEIAAIPKIGASTMRQQPIT